MRALLGAKSAVIGASEADLLILVNDSLEDLLIALPARAHYELSRLAGGKIDRGRHVADVSLPLQNVVFVVLGGAHLTHVRCS